MWVYLPKPAVPNGGNIAPCGRFRSRRGVNSVYTSRVGDEALSGAMLFWKLFITTSNPNCYLGGNNKIKTFRIDDWFPNVLPS